MRVFSMKIGIDSPESINALLQSQAYNYIIEQENGKFLTRKHVGWQTGIEVECDTIYEAVLRVTTDKTDVAIKRALKAINNILETQSTRVILRLPTECVDKFPRTTFEQREEIATRVIKVLRMFRPCRAWIGMAENFDYRSRMIIPGWQDDRFYKNLRTRDIQRVMQSRGTTTLRMSFGKKISDIYSPKSEYIYIKF